jgi:hypothetical protein
MTDYAQTLAKLEEAVKAIADESLRRIAFERLLEHELSGGKTPSKKASAEHEPAERPARSRRANSKGRTISPAPIARDELKNLQISPVQDGLPSWATLGALDKYLWILEAAHRAKVDGLANVEISSLIYDVFKENHKTEQVGNLKTRIKTGHVRSVKIQCGKKKLNGYQILKGGVDHLKASAADGAKK